MPAVNWDAFAALPESADRNFEMLCRALIRRHYGQYGRFAALAAQPGVEFHLKLHTSCPLGEPGRWYGWQCRWYDLPTGRALGTSRRQKIEKAIRATEKELPGLTDWVLWTRHPLTKGDQKWFYGLTTPMRLHLWTAAEVEEHLSGDAEILRGTHFGKLVLTPDILAEQHARAIEPIRRRWLPEVHQTVDAERALRRMLGECAGWDELRNVADRLDADASAIEADLRVLDNSLVGPTSDVVKATHAASESLRTVYSALDGGDLDLLRQQLATPAEPLGPALAALPRRLRASRQRAALTVTNAIADIHEARDLFVNLDAGLSNRQIAVVADFGRGKTQLAAQLSAPATARPAGVLLFGGDLHADHSLDDLARRVVIQGKPVRSMEALVAAVDAAGQRARRRIPIVIDGLNEAEDPRDWKTQLASLDVILRQYPYVLAVCTVRPAFADEALPSDMNRIEIPDFGHDTFDAIRRYFQHFRINAADAELPIGLLRHPLTLRLFCEVTNPTREREVGIEAMPGSLTAIFDKYLEQAADRIAELAPLTRKFYPQDVRSALVEIGLALWEEKDRSLDLETLRRCLGDEGRPRNESIVWALEQEGVLYRDPGDTPGALRVAALYDALAGHLVADAILTKLGHAGLVEWLKQPSTLSTVFGPHLEQHPLAMDTFRSLVGLVPRRLHRQQLWPLLDEPHRATALRLASDLEGTYLDAATVRELAILAVRPSTGPPELFDRLWHTRGAPLHPLNGEFLDAVLRPMAVSDRDLLWTEWVRRRTNEVLDDLRRLEKRWRETTRRARDDCLRARWVMWTLTSTVRELRDQATRTVYWFGRGDVGALFDLTMEASAINDSYVAERMLAASYGVAMAHQLPDTQFAEILRHFLTRIRDALTGPCTTQPTNHWLVRFYVQGLVTLAIAYHANSVPDGLAPNGKVTFGRGPAVEPIPEDDPRAGEVDQTLQMDFRNYTLGRLIEHRRNYDMERAGHQAAVAHVRGTVWALGWRANGLGTVDKEFYGYHPRIHQAFTERYGKKYGWIGFYTYAGMLSDAGELPRTRLSDLQVDPSFPEPPTPVPIEVDSWALPTPANDRRWTGKGRVIVPDDLLYCASVGSHAGPWIAVHGFLEAENEMLGRRVWGLLSAVLVSRADASRFAKSLHARDYPGRWWLPEVPSDYYIFAGEIPWSPDFASVGEDEYPDNLYTTQVQVPDGPPIEAEILAHCHAWESYHSSLNQAGGALVPSRPFSQAFDLRGVPQAFNQVLPDGTIAALSVGAPSGFEGHLLYLREDLVKRYAARRRLISFLWGERQLYPHPQPEPAWLLRAYRKNSQVWRHIGMGNDLCAGFVAKAQASRRRRAGRKPRKL